MRQAAAYARVSSEAQDVDLSISAQLRAIREYAARNGYTIVREYVDSAESARSTARPAFREMIALARTKESPFNSIFVWKLNRFARNRLDSITNKELLRKQGISVVSINEHLEDNPSGRLLEGIIETIDEYYSANLGQDVKRGLREAAARGFFVGSKPPYGYHKVDVRDGDKTRQKLEPDAEDSLSFITVRRIFALAIEDNGIKEIAMILNREGLRTSTGSNWTKTYVHKLLNNEAYCGTLVLGGRPGHPAIRSGEPPVRVEDAWPAILDKDTFRLVQEKMSLRAPVEVHPRVVPSFYLLSGLLYCSCGQAMIGRSAKSHRYYYYTCNRGHMQGSETCGARSLPKAKLEQIVTSQIKDRILNDEVLTELVKLVNEDIFSRHSIHKEKREVMDSELKEVGSRLARLYDALETGTLDLDDLAPRIKELRKRQDEISKARIMLEAETELKEARQFDPRTVRCYASDLRTLLTETDITKSKAFMRTFIEKVMIHGEKGIIYYKLPVPMGWDENEDITVLPIVPLSGEGGTRTPTPFGT